MSEHVKTQIFTLVGRRIVLQKPFAGFAEGVIKEQVGTAHFECFLRMPSRELHTHRKDHRLVPATVILHRGDFILPPLPRSDRRPVFLPDDSDGFAYADQPDF